jgi:hypothetical protein
VKGKKRIRRWFSAWWTTILAGIGAIAAVGGPFWGNFTTDEAARWTAFIVGAVGALVALTIPIREKILLRRRVATLEDEVAAATVQGRADFQYTLNFLLVPLLRRLGRLARAKRPGHILTHRRWRDGGLSRLSEKERLTGPRISPPNLLIGSTMTVSTATPPLRPPWQMMELNA